MPQSLCDEHAIQKDARTGTNSTCCRCAHSVLDRFQLSVAFLHRCTRKIGNPNERIGALLGGWLEVGYSGIRSNHFTSHSSVLYHQNQHMLTFVSFHNRTVENHVRGRREAKTLRSNHRGVSSCLQNSAKSRGMVKALEDGLDAKNRMDSGRSR